MSPRAIIVAARRSIVARRGGALAAHEIHDLAAPVIRACLADAGVAAEAVDEVILSNALGAGGNPARLAALAAGLPERVPGLSIDRQCCGGLDALGLARAMILSGAAEAVIAGGAESHSRRPLRLRQRPGAAPEPYDAPPFAPWPGRDPDMAEAADTLSRRLGITRAAQDEWAVESHARARAARAALTREIVTLGAEPPEDSFTRALSPALCRRATPVAGSVTAANMAVAADAAAFCLVVSERMAARTAGPKAAILGAAVEGGPPEWPGLAPVAALRRLFDALGLGPGDFASAEIMEAFAVQAIACVEGAGLDPARVNSKGGALARGHPIGASGAILAVRLFHDLAGGRDRGVAAIAAAGGIGSALALQGLG